MNPRERALFIARHMNYFLKGEYDTLILVPKQNFLNLEKYDDGSMQKEDFPGPGVIEFYGPQSEEIVSMVVKIVENGEFKTEEYDEDFGEEKAKVVNDYFLKIKRGRVEGQMVIQRQDNSLLNKDIRKKIGLYTKEGGAKRRNGRSRSPKRNK